MIGKFLPQSCDKKIGIKFSFWYISKQLRLVLNTVLPDQSQNVCLVKVKQFSSKSLIAVSKILRPRDNWFMSLWKKSQIFDWIFHTDGRFSHLSYWSCTPINNLPSVLSSYPVVLSGWEMVFLLRMEIWREFASRMT